MGMWRVLWRDTAGMGRFTDCANMTREQAVWHVARMESEHAEFVACYAVDG